MQDEFDIIAAMLSPAAAVLELLALCRAQKAQIVQLQNALARASVQYRDDAQLQEAHRRLVNDDYVAPKEVSLTC